MEIINNAPGAFCAVEMEMSVTKPGTILAMLVDGDIPLAAAISILEDIPDTYVTLEVDPKEDEATLLARAGAIFREKLAPKISGAYLNFKLTDETKTVYELWKGIGELASGRTEHNQLGLYPFNLREKDLRKLETMVRDLRDSHTSINALKSGVSLYT
jgi:hypothetical protein